MTKPPGGALRVVLICPSRYDDDGWLVQWRRSWMPSNTLACLYALTLDAGRRRILGRGVEIHAEAHDERHAVIPVRQIVRRIREAGAGLVGLVGVQTNQFPRAMDLARTFRRAGVCVVIGGFHVSGTLAMLGEPTGELKQALDLGVTLFAGEAEGHFDDLLIDACRGQLKPIYNHLHDLPDLRGRPTPVLPDNVRRRVAMPIGTIDTGRGCPFQCTFCTIINVQGRTVRSRSPEDVEKMVRDHHARGINLLFLTDDNFARNPNWEAILDRLIHLREEEGLRLRFAAQVDAAAYRIPGFVDKAAQAGCQWVFVGIESVNEQNLAAAGKRQNHVEEYRRMFRAWHAKGILTQAGYMLGFPFDTPESIRRDIRTLQSMDVDLVKFACVMPLPGSVDHRDRLRAGTWMEADLNRYTGEHPLTEHPRMTRREWRRSWLRAWNQFYSHGHLQTVLRRAKLDGVGTNRTMTQLLNEILCFRYEKIQPLEAGYLRWKLPSQRRPGSGAAEPLLHYPLATLQGLMKYLSFGVETWKLWRVRSRLRAAMPKRASKRHALRGAATAVDAANPAEGGRT